MDSDYIPSAEEVQPERQPLSEGKIFRGRIKDGSPVEISVPFENTKEAEVTNVDLEVQITTRGRTEKVKITIEGVKKNGDKTPLDEPTPVDATNEKQTVSMVKGKVPKKVTRLIITVTTTVSSRFTIKVTLKSIKACFKRKS